jgi:hypothetical protein
MILPYSNNELKKSRATAAEVLSEIEGLRTNVILRKGVHQIRKGWKVSIFLSR